MSKVHEIVTERILALLDEGTLPWEAGWVADPRRFPRSLSTRKPYRGVNAFLLGFEHDYASPWWGTYKKIGELGGQVRKGEKSTLVVFWKWFETTDPKTGEVEERPTLRYFRVFNAEQAEWANGMPEWATLPEPVRSEHERLEAAEAIVAGYVNGRGPTLVERPMPAGSNPNYRPSTDEVTVPLLGQYDRAETYYRTLYHELGHSTGHASRLDRDHSGKFGSGPYAREELVAEFTSAFLAAEAGLAGAGSDERNTAAYLASWKRALTDDPQAIVAAAGAAQRAADYVMNRSYAKEHEGEKVAA